MKYPNKDYIEHLRRKYPPGTRLQLSCMEDEIDRAAHERMDAMLPRMMEAAGVTEELKARDPMRWVGLMNTLKVQVEETIFQELIFQ